MSLGHKYQQLCKHLTLAIILVIVIGIPCSNILMSVGGIALAAMFLISPKLPQRIEHVFKQPITLLAIGLFLWHVIGFGWSENLPEAFKDVRIKLPLLLFPIAIAGLYSLSRQQLLWVIRVYVATVFFNTLILYGVYLQLYGPVIENFRDISIFIPHIRFCLNLCLAIGLLWLFPGIIKKTHLSIPVKLICSIWGVYFLSILESGISMLIVSVILLTIVLKIIFRSKSRLKIWVYAISIIIVFISLVGFTGVFYNSIFKPIQSSIVELPIKTANGNAYVHLLDNQQIENGYFVNRYIADKEMSKAWLLKSPSSLDSLNQAGFPIRSNLIRYLTSKGFSKDSAGISNLTEQDVSYILTGATNYRFTTSNGFKLRLYKIMFEWHQYQISKNPSGHSVMMRLEFLKTSLFILKKHAVWGVGTGDLKMAFQQAYTETQSLLAEQWRHRAHNQFLSIWLALGLVGFILFTSLFLHPFISKSKFPHYAWLFYIIAVASFFVEDTIETQAGVTFVMFFFSLFFIEGVPNDNKLVS